MPPRKSVPKKLQEKQVEIQEKPAEIPENPAELPAEIQEKPAEIPAELQEKPAEIQEKPAQLPAELQEKPAQLPAEIQEKPAQLQEKPAEIQEKPAELPKVKLQGRIDLIIGPIYSGKTTMIINHIYRSQRTRNSIIAIGHGDSTDSSASICSFNNELHLISNPGKKTRVVNVEELSSVVINEDETFICIDDGHLYTDIADYCQQWASKGHFILVSALNGNTDCEPFDNISKLIPFCDTFMKCSGVCTKCCDCDSTFTNLVNDELISVCRGCYIK